MAQALRTHPLMARTQSNWIAVSVTTPEILIYSSSSTWTKNNNVSGQCRNREREGILPKKDRGEIYGTPIIIYYSLIIIYYLNT